MEVIQYLDNLSEAAERMGAVNCVNVVDGKLIGENTDGKGFVQSLKTLVEPAGQKVVIIERVAHDPSNFSRLALNGVTDITSPIVLNLADKTRRRPQ